MIKYKIIDREIIYTKLPKEIFNEIKFWKKSCDKIKNHPLSKLRLHDNGGTKTNTYQVSVPSLLVDNSYWLAFVIRLCSIITNENHRKFFIRKWQGHFDNYDLWINYSHKNNSNQTHNHNGFFSGVIYFNNKKDKTIFVDKNIDFVGKKGDMIMFPSYLHHKVNKQKEDYERVTFSFNINKGEI
tara:strand:- start:30 stop:581 length:552 start_codon:yes stop_codon:yes gene_type:complete